MCTAVLYQSSLIILQCRVINADIQWDLNMIEQSGVFQIDPEHDQDIKMGAIFFIKTLNGNQSLFFYQDIMGSIFWLLSNVASDICFWQARFSRTLIRNNFKWEQFLFIKTLNGSNFYFFLIIFSGRHAVPIYLFPYICSHTYVPIHMFPYCWH